MNNASGRKRKRTYGLPRPQFAVSLKQIIAASEASLKPRKKITFTDGAIEAMRLCHAEFISFLSSSLATNSMQNLSKFIKEDTVKECMIEIELHDVFQKAMENMKRSDDEKQKNEQSTNSTNPDAKEGRDTSTNKRINPIQRSRRYVKKHVTPEMAAEQEKMLAASALAIAMRNKNKHNAIRSVDGNCQNPLVKNDMVYLSWNSADEETKSSSLDMDNYLS